MRDTSKSFLEPLRNTPMISLRELPDRSTVHEMKTRYMGGLTAPMDGMWEVGFINPVPHWEINRRDEILGYVAINDEGTLLQYYLKPEFERETQAVFKSVLEQRAIKSATVNTIDPAFLSVCLDNHVEISVHTYVYELQSSVEPNHAEAGDTNFRPVEAEELDRTVAFQTACLGGDENLRGWLSGYSANLIARRELSVLCSGEDWIGLGEYRKSDSQEGIVDVGMMVSPERRGQGWATHILCLLVEQSAERGHSPICSTTVENVASQKAIGAAGFTSRHRIMNVSFK